MIPILANAMVEITEGGASGDHIVVDPPIAIGALYLFLLLLPLLLVLVLVYFKFKFRHQQILLALEKGQPITDLISPRNKNINWIPNLAAGIGLLSIGVLMAVLYFWERQAVGVSTPDPLSLLVSIAVGGIGLIFLLRGILQRNREKAQKPAA